LQFVVRTFGPAGDRAFSHVFREDAAGSRIAGEGQLPIRTRAEFAARPLLPLRRSAP
jgi:hypothetical protein